MEGIRKPACFLCTFLVLFVQGFSGYLFAQGVDHHEPWVDLMIFSRLSDRYTLNTDLGPRFNLGDGDDLQLYFRTGPQYKLNDLQSVTAGAGIFSTYTNEGSSFSQHELRFFQGYKLIYPRIGPLLTFHFLRLEEQLFFLPRGEHNFRWRPRYLLKFTLPLNRANLIDKTLYTSGMGEIFVFSDKPFQKWDWERYRLSLR
jgi:hypothetical protein